MVKVNPQAAPKVTPNTASRKGKVAGLDKLGPNDGISRKNTRTSK